MIEQTSRRFGDLFNIPLKNGVNKPTKIRGSGIKMVNMGEIFAYTRIGDIEMERAPLTDKEREYFLLEAGDLLFARQSLVREGAGKCSLFLGASEPVTWEGHIIRARLNKDLADPAFIFYLFNSNFGKNLIQTIVEQVAAAGIRGSDLSELEIPYLPVDEQKKIGVILSLLDDKIELNRRMNRTLEEMAAAIFKSWFVDFDPVMAKSEGRQPFGMSEETARLFPSKFIDSYAELLPEGWKTGKIGDIGQNIRNGITPNRNKPDMPYIGLEHMPRKDIALGEWGTFGEVVSNKYQFRKGDILFGKLRPYFHKVGVATIDGVCSTDILVIRPLQTEWFGILLGHLSSTEFVNYADASSGGTRMPRTNWEDMSKYEIAIPNIEVSRKFTEIISPMINKIIANIHETRKLTDLRDILLPKLLSGEIRLKQVEKS